MTVITNGYMWKIFLNIESYYYLTDVILLAGGFNYNEENSIDILSFETIEIMQGYVHTHIEGQGSIPLCEYYSNWIKKYDDRNIDIEITIKRKYIDKLFEFLKSIDASVFPE